LRILNVFEKQGVKIILTDGHLDHFGGTQAVAGKLNVPATARGKKIYSG
jgi:hydroxyacylglutathione hydrolase